MSRILRRPMFRGGRVSSYGTGIASGLADGGNVQPLLVGQHPEEFKDAEGREQHWAPLAYLGGAGLTALRTAGPLALRTAGKYGRQGINWGKGLFKPKTGTDFVVGPGGASTTKAPGMFDKLATTPMSQWLGKDPVIRGTVGSGKFATKGVKPVAKWALGTPSGLTASYLAAPYIKDAWNEWFGEEEVVQPPQKGPPGGGETSEGSGEAFYKEKEVDPDTGEPVELTAKEMVTQNKKIFAELLGSKKARGQDISEMLLGFAGAEGDDTWSKTKSFFRDEAKREGKAQKIDETAAALAINDYIAGKRSLENLKQTLGVVDYKIKASIEASQLKGGAANWMSDLDKEATSQKGGVTDLNVIRSVLFKTTGKNVSQISKDKKNLDDIDMDDLNIGFNIVSHKGGKTIIEKFEDGTVRERTDLPIT